MSTTRSNGLDGVSIQTSFVSARIARATFCGSVMSTSESSSPHGPNTSRANLIVPK
jgi:hypothetical protein